MSIKVQNGQLFDSIKALQALTELELPIKASFAVSDAISKINVALATADKLHKEIVAKETLRDGEGNAVHPNGNKELVTLTNKGAEDLQALMAIEVEVAVEKIKLSTFGEKVSIKPATLLPLTWLLEM